MTEKELHNWYREQAKSQYHEEGQIEIDDLATVSDSEMVGGDAGAYVQAWVWVDKPGQEDESEDKGEDETQAIEPQENIDVPELLKKCGLQDPDDLGQSEYRAIHETLVDGLEALNEDQDEDDREVAMLHLGIAIADEFISLARSIRNNLFASIVRTERKTQ